MRYIPLPGLCKVALLAATPAFLSGSHGYSAKSHLPRLILASDFHAVSRISTVGAQQARTVNNFTQDPEIAGLSVCPRKNKNGFWAEMAWDANGAKLVISHDMTMQYNNLNIESSSHNEKRQYVNSDTSESPICRSTLSIYTIIIMNALSIKYYSYAALALQVTALLSWNAKKVRFIADSEGDCAFTLSLQGVGTSLKAR